MTSKICKIIELKPIKGIRNDKIIIKKLDLKNTEYLKTEIIEKE